MQTVYFILILTIVILGVGAIIYCRNKKKKRKQDAQAYSEEVQENVQETLDQAKYKRLFEAIYEWFPKSDHPGDIDYTVEYMMGGALKTTILARNLEILLKKEKKGEFEKKAPEIREWIHELSTYLKQHYNGKFDENPITSIIVWKELSELDELDKINPDFWISWIITLTDQDRIRTELEKFKGLADSYLGCGCKIQYFYILYQLERNWQPIKSIISQEMNEIFGLKDDIFSSFLIYKKIFNDLEKLSIIYPLTWGNLHENLDYLDRMMGNTGTEQT